MIEPITKKETDMEYIACYRAEDEIISLFATVPEGLTTKEEVMEWMDNLSEADFKPLIVEE